MPIYEYRCSNCAQVTEKISTVMHNEIDCPNCEAKAQRIVSLFTGETTAFSSSASHCKPGSGFT